MIRVVAGVMVEGGRAMAARRGAGMSHPGAWEFPGGKVEAGETDEEALARELNEELGIHVTVGRRLTEVRRHYGGVDLHLLFYAVTGRTGELKAIEHDALRWLVPGELDEVAWHDSDREAIPVIRSWLLG